MDSQANITLTALNGDVSFAERHLTLHTNRRTIPVGRASKSVSKGLLGAADNAWFDSPVMSRDHAEISLDEEEKLITIEDIGSMHGTYLNNFELPRNSPMPISDGDVVVFGAEVRRGPETFPACAFRVNYKFGQYKPANTFAFPDSSEVEDGEEDEYDEFSEDDREGKEQASSEDDISIESPLPKTARSIDAIDLTGDDSPGASLSNRVDLTGETLAEKNLMEVMAGRPTDIDHNADSLSIGIYAGNIPILVGSEDEDEELSSDFDHQSEDSDSDDSGNLRHVIDVYETDEESENEDPLEDSDMESVAEPVDEDAEEARETSPVNNLTRYAIATSENPVVLLSDIRTRIDLPESINGDDDDESEFDLTEAGAAGMRALFGDSRLQTTADMADTDESEGVTGPPISYIEPPQEFVSGPSLFQGNMDSTPQPQMASMLAQPFPIVRQPSPSDAAMVKTANTPKRASVCDLGTSGKHNPQTLGEKTGKGAFFEAREINKAKFNAGELRGPSLFLSEDPVTDKESTGKPFLSGTSVNRSNLQQPPSSLSPADVIMFSNEYSKAAMSDIPTREPCSFLDQPDQWPIPDRAPSPLPDMTSAFNYNTSKGSMNALNAPKSNPRSAIKIPDIIETSSSIYRTSNSLKRKSDSISVVPDQELRLWANYSSSSNVSKLPSEIIATDSQPRFSAVSSEVVTSVSNITEPRPTKRLKKLLENVGYAALGGVAVGAGLFTALVVTAPDFL